MSESFCLIHKCAGGCETRIEVTAENSTGFQLDWYESIFFDLCPACQATPEGMRKIKRDRELRKLGRARMEKRLTRIAQNSH